MLRLRKTRLVKMTNKESGVEFKIMSDTDIATYLGDIIRNEVDDDMRWGQTY